MKTSKLENAPKLEPLKGVKIKILGTLEELTLCYIEIQPNTKIEAHKHINEQIGTCIGGTGELNSGGKTIKTRPGSSWAIPPNEIHSYINNGEIPVKIVEAFSPKREDYIKIAE